MKSNKPHTSSAPRKERGKKKERLCGWSHSEEFLLRDDIGIESWFEDKCNSDDDKGRRYKCALVESFERKRRSKERTKRFQKPNSATNQNQKESIHAQNTKPECSSTNLSTPEQDGSQKNFPPEQIVSRKPTLSSKSAISLARLSDKGCDSATSTGDHVTMGQSLPSYNTGYPFAFHESKDETPRMQDSSSTSNDSPIVTLLRYEERLKTRRENKLKKRFSDDEFRKVDKSDCISPKISITMTSVSFTQGMIQPIKTEKNCKYNLRAKLPSLEMKNHIDNSNKMEVNAKMTSERQQNLQKGLDIQKNRGIKIQSTYKSEENDSNSKKTENKPCSETTGIKSVNERKFNFDVLEKYALIRNARKDTNFTEYVKMIRQFHSLPGQNSKKHIYTENKKVWNFETGRERASSENLSFDTVRALWHEAQRARLGTHSLSERLSFHSKGPGSVLMLAADPRDRSLSEPIGKHAKNGNESLSYNHKGKFHIGKYTCPLQRVLDVTNRRMQANEAALNQVKNIQNVKTSEDKNSIENNCVGITKSKTGIHYFIIGRTTPAKDAVLDR